jgi:hypothetical protein
MWALPTSHHLSIDPATFTADSSVQRDDSYRWRTAYLGAAVERGDKACTFRSTLLIG